MIAIKPIRIEGDLAYVTLSRGYTAVIDSADVSLVEGFNWYAQVSTHTVYAARNDRTGLKPKTVLMHRVIMGEPEGFDIDHMDGYGLNNRRVNLRVATRQQNRMNQRLLATNSSGLKGVSWDKNNAKWHARITLNRKTLYLGRYVTAEDAHAAYCRASKELHGEFGRTA